MPDAPDTRGAAEAGPYSPKPAIFTDHPRVEYVTRDCPTVSDRVDGWLSLIRDMATNEIIGASIDLPKDALDRAIIAERALAEAVEAEREAAAKIAETYAVNAWGEPARRIARDIRRGKSARSTGERGNG